jgi:acyl carrier protein
MSRPESTGSSETIRDTVLAVLTTKLSQRKFSGGIDASTELLELDLIDSTDLLDLILEVEERLGVQFNPEQIDFEAGLTLGDLIDAFRTH